MITAAEYGETSWELSVQVDQKSGDESMKFKLRVKGDLHVGGLMLKLAEKISKCLTWVEKCCAGVGKSDSFQWGLILKARRKTKRNRMVAILNVLNSFISSFMVSEQHNDLANYTESTNDLPWLFLE